MANIFTTPGASDYQRKGWGELCFLGPDQSAHNDVVGLSGRLTEEITNILQSKDSREGENESIHVEYLKGAVRSIIRYSPSGRIFAKVVARNFIEKGKGHERWYITPPYIIFHLPNDLTEAGRVHSDSLPFCGEMFTSWTPINKRQIGYAALTLHESTHSKTFSTMYKIINTLKSFTPLHDVIQDDFYFRLFGKKKIDLIPDKDKSFYWDSHLLHKGNLNIENESHLAMVFRISEKPLWYEPACTLKELIEDQVHPADNPRLNDLLLEFQKAEKLAENVPNFHIFDISYQNWIQGILKNKLIFNQNTIKHLAFGLTLIGHANPKSNQSLAFYLISYLLAKESIVGFRRVIEMLSVGDRPKLIAFLVDAGCTFGYQDMMLLRSLKISVRKANLNRETHNTLHTWS